MGAFADLDAYVAAVANASPGAFLGDATFLVDDAWLCDPWEFAPLANGNPSTAVALGAADSKVSGAWDGGTNSLYPVSATFWNGGASGGTQGSNDHAYVILIDRLSHQGGLSGTAAGAQTTNLPTAALTRYTSGVGVMMGLTIYTAIGSTAATVTVTYTNTNDVSKTTPAVSASGNRNLYRFIPLPFADGDVGVKSVESVTLSGTTGTVGNFGVTLFRPLLLLSFDYGAAQRPLSFLDGGFSGGLPEIHDDASLHYLSLVMSSTVVAGTIGFGVA